jgi:hypothetical protein
MDTFFDLLLRLTEWHKKGYISFHLIENCVFVRFS